MYYRSQGYPYQKNINLPPNYRGNAFQDKPEEQNDKREEIISSEQPEETSKETQQKTYEAIEVPSKETALLSKKDSATETGSFKQNSFLNGKIGSEELLLLAVIFLISDSEGSDDILWLLILLLFIK